MKDTLALLEEKDAEYAEKLIKEFYSGEIDRKDKILSTMTVVSSPITILIAGIAFLFATLSENKGDYLNSRPDIMAIIAMLLIGALLYYLIYTTYEFHKLLDGESFKYLPNAEQTLKHIVETKKYCVDNAIIGDGKTRDFARIDFLLQYAECAKNNCDANDKRLQYRQGVFRGTTLAVVFTALSFVAIAIHRAQPDIWNPVDYWRSTGARPTNSPLGQSTERPAQQPAAADTTSAPPSTSSGAHN